MRLLPANLEAERNVICAWLMFPKEGGCLLAELGAKPIHFHEPAHRTVVDILFTEWREGRNCDADRLTPLLRAAGKLEQVGGAAFVTELARATSTAQNLRSDWADVFSAWQLREQAVLYAQKVVEASEPGAEPSTILQTTADGMAAISGSAQASTAKTIKTLLFEKLERMENGTPNADMIRTGIDKLDRESPLRRGGMSLIAGERKAGKSILSLTIALHVALASLPVIYFSLEDPAPNLIDRLFASATHIPMHRHHAAEMNEGDHQRAASAVQVLAGKTFIIRDDLRELPQILAACRMAKVKHPNLALIVVDYAQLVKVSLGKNANREQEVAAISRAFRELGMELNAAILLLCQLNADGATRESKALEQDCTAMWKISHTDPEEGGKRLIAIPFQRNGESGICFPVAFLGKIARIENFTEEEPPTERRLKD